MLIFDANTININNVNPSEHRVLVIPDQQHLYTVAADYDLRAVELPTETQRRVLTNQIPQSVSSRQL